MLMKTLFVLTGPTGVGKTALSLRIAEHLGVPVINADSRQIYAGIPIGTAAPTPEQMARVPHYLVGTRQLTDYYSASMFETEVMALLTPPGPLSGHRHALMTGGSMMYIDAVCQGIDDIPTVDEETRETLRQRLDHEGLERLGEGLRIADPEYYQIVDRKNTRRVVHALEICYMTGKTYTSFRTNSRKPRPFDVVKIALTRKREELYSRINRRVLQMIDQGLEEEARRVYPFKGENSLNTVGYREMFDYIEQRCTLDEAIERIQSATRRYCRKQLTWLKRDPDVKWFEAGQEKEIMAYIDSKTEK